MTPAARTASTLKATLALFAIWCAVIAGMGISKAAGEINSRAAGERVYFAPAGTNHVVQDLDGEVSTVIRTLRPVITH